MGYYDGIAATREASAYTVAKETHTPVILVVSARGAGSSLGAVIEGFIRHKPEGQIQGVVFNDASESRYSDLKQIAESAGARTYGFLPRKAEWALPSRHLGLWSADEITGLQDILTELGRQAERTLDVGGLLSLAETAGGKSHWLSAVPAKLCAYGRTPLLRIAIAKDEAFCFLYAENLELLQALGCEPVFFSPLRDNALPENIQGLYLCGGYPEVYAQQIAQNASMRESVRQALSGGLPAIAEGGGFLFLHDCGVIRGTVYKTEKLQRFGYITLRAMKDNLLCKSGETIRAHEFHYWDSDNPGDGFTAQKAGRELIYSCIHATETLYAGFPHLYFPANPTFAERLVERMSQYELKRRSFTRSTR
jgi:cobyrinic acid a,c-diamide synthase